MKELAKRAQQFDYFQTWSNNIKQAGQTCATRCAQHVTRCRVEMLRACGRAFAVETCTSFPNFVPISSDTLAATLIAATRRGCVQPIFILPLVKP